MKGRIKKILINAAYPAGVAAAVLLVWYLASLAVGVTLILPTPGEAFGEFAAYLKSAEFYVNLGSTVLRSLYGFLLSFIIAAVLSLLALNGVVKKIVSCLMAVVRAVPTMSVILILVMVFSPDTAPVTVALIVICPTLYSQFSASIESIDPKLIQMSRIYKVGLKDRIFKLYLPNMADGILEGCANGISLNIKLVIAAEALALPVKSIGKMMWYSKAMLEAEKLFALTIAAVILSVAAESIIRLIKRLLLRWKYDKV